MKVISPGKPLIVPTERQQCPRCSAVLCYDVSDIKYPPVVPIYYGEWKSPEDLRRQIEKDREFQVRYAEIRCPHCGGQIIGVEVPRQPYYEGEAQS